MRADASFAVPVKLWVLLCVFAAVLALISCIGIINSFSSNLAERRKQIGMMRAVGATRRQIIRIYGREALVISLICAPASILLSGRYSP